MTERAAVGRRLLALTLAIIWSAVAPAAARTNLSTNTGTIEAPLAVVQEDLHRVDVVSLERDGTRVTRRLGRRGSGPGELLLPGGAAVAHGGAVWVSDSGNNRLQRFDGKGEVDLVVDRLGGYGDLSRPGALALAPAGDRLYVTDTGHDRVVVLGRDGRALTAWGTPGQGPGSMLRPHGIALSPDGASVYLIDLVSPRVQVFTPDGRFVRATAEGPAGPAIINPTAISAGPDGTVYLTDETLGRVSRFSPELEFLDAWGGAHGSGPGAFYNPQGVAVDAAGRVWVVDYGNHRGQTFSSTGEFLFTFLDGQVGVIEEAGDDSAGHRSASLALVAGAVMIVVETGRRARARGRRRAVVPVA